MDTPISQVNTRLFARLPADTGLGLLFATGGVSQIVLASGGRPIQFTLRHAGYALRCKVAPSADLDFDLVEGQQIRATGFLNFSSQSAQFHLLVRDLELLSDVAPSETPDIPERSLERSIAPDWLMDIQKRAQAAPEQLAPADIPEWVLELAPPEAPPTGVGATNVLWGKQRVEAALQPPAEIEVPELPRLNGDEQLLDHLLEALERSDYEDVELTAETLAQFRGAPPIEEEPFGPALPDDLPILEIERAQPDSFLTKPYGQLLLIAVLFAIVAVVMFLLFLLSQNGLL